MKNQELYQEPLYIFTRFIRGVLDFWDSELCVGTNLQMEERVPANLKRQLALAVRSIQWTYAIFWSISARQPGYYTSSFLSFLFSFFPLSFNNYFRLNAHFLLRKKSILAENFVDLSLLLFLLVFQFKYFSSNLYNLA